MGVARGVVLELNGELLDPGRPAVLPPRDEIMRTTLSRRSDLAEAASRIDAAEADIYLETVQAYPWFSFVEVGYRFGVDEIDPRDWTFRVALTVPIFSWNRGGIDAAHATRDWMESRFDAEVERVSREVEERYGAVQMASEVVASIHGETSDAVQSVYQKTLDAMNQGGVNAIRVAQAKVQVAQLRRQQIRSLRGYAEALQALYVATRGAFKAAP
jgi:outer membrane protein TolC